MTCIHRLGGGVVVVARYGRFVSSSHEREETVAALLSEAERLEAVARRFRALAGESAKQCPVRSEE